MSVKTILIKPHCKETHRFTGHSLAQHVDYVTCKEHEAIGKWVVIGTPTEPSAIFNCGTDVVWPIEDAEFFSRKPSQDNPKAYVCRHMIAIGD